MKEIDLQNGSLKPRMAYLTHRAAGPKPAAEDQRCPKVAAGVPGLAGELSWRQVSGNRAAMGCRLPVISAPRRFHPGRSQTGSWPACAQVENTRYVISGNTIQTNWWQVQPSAVRRHCFTDPGRIYYRRVASKLKSRTIARNKRYRRWFMYKVR